MAVAISNYVPTWAQGWFCCTIPAQIRLCSQLTLIPCCSHNWQIVTASETRTHQKKETAR